MTINLHIERLVLDGLPPESGGGLELQAALETEIVRRLKERGVDGISAGAVPSLAVAAIELSAGASPSEWGRQIAHSLGDGLIQTPARHPQRRLAGPPAAHARDSLRTSVSQRTDGKSNL